MDDELKSVFITETEDMLLKATNLLLVEDQDEELLARINHVFRVVHSIKGGSQFLGLDELAEISHHLEDLLGPLRSGKLEVDEGITTLMLDALELMEMHLQYVRSGEIITTLEFERKKKLFQKIALIRQPEVLPERTQTLLPVSMEISSFVGKRLVYIHARIDAESIMPQVQQFLVLERLKEVGRVVYSLPTIEGLEMPGNSLENEELTIVLSTDATDELIRRTCDVGDIIEITLLGLEAGLELRPLDKRKLPTVHEVSHFEQVVTQLLEEFGQKEYSRVKTSALILEMEAFGEQVSISTESWFPGGVAGWRRYIALLAQTGKLDGNDRENMAKSILQGLWESVFEALCNKVYFYVETLEEQASLSTSIFKERISITEEDSQLAVLDLSRMRVLEPADLLILHKLKTNLEKHGMRMALVSNGTNTRRQVNVLEGSAHFTRGLHIFPNAFSASFYTSQRL